MNREDYAKLKIEQATDPSNVGYTDKTWAERAALMETVIPNGMPRTIVPARQLTGDMAFILAKLDQLPDSTPVPEAAGGITVSFLKSLVRYSMNADVINVSLAKTQQMFGVMEAYELMNSEDAANFSSQDCTRTEQVLGMGKVVNADIVRDAVVGEWD